MSRYGAPSLIFLVVLVALLLSAGCAGRPAEVTASLGQEVSLSVGQAALIEGEGLRVTFTEVVGDSRCPSGVECPWRGEVSCEVEVTYSGQEYQMTLTQPGLTSEPGVKSFNQYRFSFTVDPYPQKGKEIDRSDYRLNLTVDKVQLTLAGD